MQIMYQSIPSLTKPSGRPRRFAHSHSPGVGFSLNFLCPEDLGFELKKSKAVRTLDEIKEYVIPSLQKISDWLKADFLSWQKPLAS